MSFAFSLPLQRALFAGFVAHPELAALIGARIYDAPPEPAPQAPLLLLGDEEVEPWSTADRLGAAHAVKITVAAPSRGFAVLKKAAAAVCEVALGELAVEGGHVAFSSFLGGRTLRPGPDGLRRIEMRFRIAIEGA